MHVIRVLIRKVGVTITIGCSVSNSSHCVHAINERAEDEDFVFHGVGILCVLLPNERQTMTWFVTDVCSIRDSSPTSV